MENKEKVKELGTQYLNDLINMRGEYEKVQRDFTKDILAYGGDEAVSIINEYVGIGNMLSYTYGLYRNNVDTFETEILQLNSVISTSLLVEYRIHDLLFNKDLSLKSNQKNDIDTLKEMLETLNKTETEAKEIFKMIETDKDLLNKPLTEAERLHFLHIKDDLNKRIDALTEQCKQQLEDAKKQQEKNINKLKALKKNEYYIGTLSKDNNLISLIDGILLYYVTNDIVEGVRETFFKKYNVIVENKRLKTSKVHCLNVGAFKITQNKLADIIRVSMLTNGENIIEKNTLGIFNLLINLEAETKKKEYISLRKKYTKLASKGIEEEKGQKVDVLACLCMENAEELLKEKGWCGFD